MAMIPATLSTWVLMDHAIAILTLRSVSYTHLRAHETVLDLVCRLLLEQKKQKTHTQHTTQLTYKNNNNLQTEYAIIYNIYI